MEKLSPKMIKFLGIEPERGVKEFINYNINKLRYLGIWKWDVPHFKLHRAFAYLQIVCLFFMNASSAVSGYYNSNDLDHLTTVSITIVFMYLLIFKNIYLIVRMEKACRLMYQLENEFFTAARPPTAEQLTIINKYGARAKFFTIMRSNMALSIITFWVLAPIKDMLGDYSKIIFEDDLTTRENKTVTFLLPFEGRFPYDIQNNVLYYVLTYIFQVFCGLSVFVGMPAWDMFFVSVFIHTSGHFKALQHVLFNLQRDSQQMKAFKRNQEDNCQALEKSSQGDNFKGN